MDITHITSLLGGIALFLYGMSIMGAGLEKLAGGKMQGVLYYRSIFMLFCKSISIFRERKFLIWD